MAYKWANPHEWLRAKVDYHRRELASKAPLGSGEVGELIGIINSLLGFVDSDDIQDVFLIEMEEDGYFEEIEE
jgi:hypothetical protein